MINVGTLAKIRRMHLRDGLPIKEIERRTGLARNTIKAWLRKGEMVEPRYPQRASPSKLDAYRETLTSWLGADQHRGRRDRRSIARALQGLGGVENLKMHYCAHTSRNSDLRNPWHESLPERHVRRELPPPAQTTPPRPK